mmetsp:Transcript_4360/g.5173  ORF Transcript_4360/g.5173 Transcript_4360/m.5173 type:complete len:83 (+) Transcript_4360:117-365(+)
MSRTRVVTKSTSAFQIPTPAQSSDFCAMDTANRTSDSVSQLQSKQSFSEENEPEHQVFISTIRKPGNKTQADMIERGLSRDM